MILNDVSVCVYYKYFEDTCQAKRVRIVHISTGINRNPPFSLLQSFKRIDTEPF